MDAVHTSGVWILLSQATLETVPPWLGPLANGSIAAGMLIWFVWRDNRDSKKRDEQHKENIEQQRRVEDAYRTSAEIQVIGLQAMKNIDKGYSDLLAQVAQQNRRSQ